MASCPIDKFFYHDTSLNPADFLRQVIYGDYKDISFDKKKNFTDYQNIISHSLLTNSSKEEDNESLNLLSKCALKKLFSSFHIKLKLNQSLLFCCHDYIDSITDLESSDDKEDNKKVADAFKSLLFDKSNTELIKTLEVIDFSNNPPDFLKESFCNCIFSKQLICKIYKVILNDNIISHIIIFKESFSSKYHDIVTYSNINKILKLLKNPSGNITFYSYKYDGYLFINKCNEIWPNTLYSNATKSLKFLSTSFLLKKVNEIDINFQCL